MASNTRIVVILFKCLLLIACPIVSYSAEEECEEYTDDVKCISEYRLSPEVVPVHYDILLHLFYYDFLAPYQFSGRTNITINILYATQNIRLHKHKLNIREVNITLANGTLTRPSVQGHPNSHALVLYFDFTLFPGIYTLHFFYIGRYSHEGEEGLLRLPLTKLENNTKSMLVTQLGKTAARRVFPCFDEPKLKATFNISTSNHIQYEIFSNMPILTKRYDVKNSEVWTYFEKTPLMSTHHLGIVMTIAQRCNSDTKYQIRCKNLETFIPHRNIGLQYHWIDNLLTKYTNTSLRLPKIDIIILPDYAISSSSNSSSWGIIYMKESLVTNNTIQKLRQTDFIAHEMAKQWFAHVVGPTWWSDVWLTDALVLYFKAYIFNLMYQSLHTMDFLVLSLQKCIHLDDIRSKKDIFYYTANTYEPDFIETFSIADKRFVLLHMLENMITASVFQNGVRLYFDKHQFGSATSHDFWDAMQSALNTRNVTYKFEIKEVMRNWLNQTMYSLIKVKRNYKTNQVIISRHDTKKVDNRTETPLSYVVQSFPDFNQTMAHHWLKKDYIHWLRSDTALVVPVAQHDWVIVNIRQGGYYRVNYDNTNWEKIAAGLNYDDFKKIHVINRAQIIDDAYYSIVKRQLDVFTFLHILRYLPNEVEYMPWVPVFRIFSYLWKFIVYELSNVPLILRSVKTNILAILKELLRNIGYEDDPDNDGITMLMRATALKWLCAFGDSSCKERASRIFNARIKNPDLQNALIFPWEKWIYCTALEKAERDIWDKVMALYGKRRQTEVLEVLTCTKKSEIVKDYFVMLSQSVEGVDTEKALVRWSQHSHIFDILISKYAQNNEIREYILQNFEKVKPRSYSRTMVIKEIISNIYSKKQLNETYNFLKKDGKVRTEDLTTMINTRLTQLQDMKSSFVYNFS